jgi:predicted metal-dependent hydrolase
VSKRIFTFEGIDFQIIRRRVKNSRIVYRRRNPVAILPPGVNPARLFRAHRTSITRTIRSYRQALREADRLEILPVNEQEFQERLESLVAQHAGCLGVKVGEIKLRKMKRRWGTCYANGRIFLNRAIRLLPDRLISYIIFHEILHIKIPHHNRRFKDTMKDRFGNIRDMERELKLYGLRLLED